MSLRVAYRRVVCLSRTGYSSADAREHLVHQTALPQQGHLRHGGAPNSHTVGYEGTFGKKMPEVPLPYL